MRRAAAALLLTVVIAASGCGDDDSTAAAPRRRTATSTSTSTSTTASAGPAATAAPVTSTSTTTMETLECGAVVFTPNSEDGASEITATAISCEEARAFVEVAGTHTSSGGPESVEVDGWSCTRTEQRTEPLPNARYQCANGGRTVTYLRS